MKILFLVSSLQGGGAERVATLLCNAWALRGFSVTLCATFSGRGACSYSVERAVSTIYLADRVPGRQGKVARLLALRRLTLELQPDVIVSFLPHVNVAALLSTIGTDVPVIACERIYPPGLTPPLSRLYQIARRVTYRWASVLVAQTHDTEKWLESRFPNTAIACIPNPIELPMRTVEPVLAPQDIVTDDRRLLLSVGRLDKQKRFDYLVAAFASVVDNHPGWDLAILGDGAERERLAMQIKQHEMADRVHLVGFAGNLEEWYRRADVFVLPSAYEGFPNVLVEAMAHELPVIAFDIKSGPSDITMGGARGVLLPNDDHVARLSDAFEMLFSNQSLRKEFGQKAGEVRGDYALDKVMELWERVLVSAAFESSR